MQLFQKLLTHDVISDHIAVRSEIDLARNRRHCEMAL